MHDSATRIAIRPLSPGVKHAPLHPGVRFSSSGLVQPSSYRSGAVTVCLSGILCCVVEVVNCAAWHRMSSAGTILCSSYAQGIKLHPALGIATGLPADCRYGVDARRAGRFTIETSTCQVKDLNNYTPHISSSIT
jgi:hypothetical protein